MPFLEAQVQIRQKRDKIAKQRFEKQLHEYLAKLEAKTPISTIFDGQKDPDAAAIRPTRVASLRRQECRR